MNKNSKILAVILFLFIAISSFIYFSYISSSSENKPEVQRDAEINNSVFTDLPQIPSNFTLIKRNFYDNQIKDLSRIQEGYYKQPEWYPTWISNGRGWFTKHDYLHWGIHGYGFFPSEINYGISNMSKWDDMEVYTFLHTSWGIETWQGLKIVPIYNTTYFDVEIIPKEILLEPTFPKFYYNWSHKVMFKITAKQRVPVGEYTFSVNIDSPLAEKNEEWTWDVLDKYTNSLYHTEIQECKKQVQASEKCSKLIELRQNKYVSGGQFSPSNQFIATIIVNE